MTKLDVKIFALPRTGGTLLKNIIMHLNDGVRPIHYHMFIPQADRVIVPIRDLRDSIVSHWRVMEARFDDPRKKKLMTRKDMLNFYNDMRVDHWGASFRTMMNFINYNQQFTQKNIMYLRYEKFLNNFDAIFNALEASFLKPLKISKKQRSEMTKKFALERQRKIAKKFKDFDSWDPKTMIHGHHILKGTPGTWKELVNKKDHQFLTSLLAKELKFLGYKL